MKYLIKQKTKSFSSPSAKELGSKLKRKKKTTTASQQYSIILTRRLCTQIARINAFAPILNHFDKQQP